MPEINGLPAASALAGTEVFPADQGVDTVKVTTQAVVDRALSQIRNGASAGADTLVEIEASLALKANLASPTFTGAIVGPSFQASGKTGATATPITLAGGTASGSPASGTHVKGEVVLDDLGRMWYCTVAGTPGTWVQSTGSGVRPWTALGNLGSTESIAPIDTAVYRYTGTLDQNTTITVALDADEQFDLALIQDATGGRTVTWSGVDVWLTSTGTAGVPGTAAGALSRFYFEKISGVTYGYHVTETIAAPTGAGTPHQFSKTGWWYPVHPGTTSPTSTVAGRPYFSPLWVNSSITLESVAIWCSTLGASSTTVAAVYDDDNVGLPGTRLLDVNSGAAWDTNTTGMKKTTGLSLALTQGLYWVGILSLTAAPTLVHRTSGSWGIPYQSTDPPDVSGYQNAAGFQGGSAKTSLPTDVSSWTFTGTATVPQPLLKTS